MVPAKRRLLVGGLLLLGAAGYLAYAGTGSGWVYFVDVDQFIQQHAAPGRRARIHGTVADADARPADLIAHLTLVGTSSRLPVLYRGPIPELFQTGRQVVVEGALDNQGVFQADVLMTKCASKYEGHADHGAPQVKP